MTAKRRATCVIRNAAGDQMLGARRYEQNTAFWQRAVPWTERSRDYGYKAGTFT